MKAQIQLHHHGDGLTGLARPEGLAPAVVAGPPGSPPDPQVVVPRTSRRANRGNPASAQRGLHTAACQ